MNVTIQEKSIPTLAPLGLARPCGELKLCGRSWRELVRHRWVSALGRLNEVTLTTDLDFWPSCELLERLQGLPEGFQVVDASGRVLAEGTHVPYRNALGLSVNGSTGAVRHRRVASAKRVEVDAGSLVVRYPWDLLSIQEQVLSGAPHGAINGTIHETSVIDGNLDLGDGSMILPGVYITGTVVIGQNCLVGPNCTIRGFTAIGDGCRIGQGAEIKNSIVMDGVKVSHVSYIGDSIIASGADIGAGTMIANFRHDGGRHRSMVEGRLVDTGRDHFGAVIAEDVHTGVNTSIYPGRKISAGVTTRPGAVVQHDL